MSMYDAGDFYDSGGYYDAPGDISPPEPPLPPQPTVADATLELYNQLPPNTINDWDQAQNWPLLRFMDGLGQLLQPIDDVSADTPTRPGWSQLLDPTIAPTWALPWLAQFVGVRFNATTSTDAQQRAAIQAEQGFTRGTPAAMQLAVSKWLNPGQQVLIYERTPDPYSLTVVVSLAAATSEPYWELSNTYATYAAWKATGDLYGAAPVAEAQIIAALESQKPAGVVLTVTFVVGATYAQLAAAFTGAYSTLTSEFSTYAAMGVWQPS